MNVNSAEIQHWFEAVYGEREGVAFLAAGSGNKWREHPFVCPRDIPKMVKTATELAADLNVYATPLLMESAKRGRNAARPGHLIFAEADQPSSDEAVEWLDALGGWAVESGSPSHLHAYVPLDQPVEQRELELLNTRLAQRINGDPAYTPHAGALLRPTGTLNHKLAEPAPVRWLISPDGRPGLPLAVVRAALPLPAAVSERPNAPDLDELLANPPEGPSSGRNQWLAKVSGHLALLHRDDPGAYLTEGLAAARLCDRTDFQDREVRRVLDSIWQREQTKPPDSEGPPTQASALIRLARDRYDLIQSDEGEPYAVPHFDQPGARIALGMRGSRALRTILASTYFDTYGKAASGSALADALSTLEGWALRQDRTPVAVRIARHGDDVVVDLGDESGRVVIASPRGWRVVDTSPVMFRRTELVGAHSEPVAGGDLDLLRQLLNVSDESWDLLVAYLVAALVPEIPHPVLWMSGEQGTGKTTAMRMISSLIDPSPADARSAPRDIQEWVVVASGSFSVPIDNISSIPDWLSDAICRAATGDAFPRRKLYTDSDIVVLAFRRVVMLNGIDAGNLRNDLGDRLVPVELERIPDWQRRPEIALRQEFEANRGRLFGALLDLLTSALAELPSINLDESPRMADFARIVAAVDKIRGTAALRAYTESRKVVAEQVLDSDLVAGAIRQLLTTSNGEWAGSPHELLSRLSRPEDAPRSAWPNSPQQMGARVRRLAPALERLGIHVELHRVHAGRRIILTQTQQENLL